MIEQLQALLKQKKSKEFYASKLGISVDEVTELMKELKDTKEDLTIEASYKHNIDAGTYQVEAYYEDPPTPEVVIRDHKIDITKFKLSAYYSKQKPKGWLVTALFKNITEEELLDNKFLDFLKSYKPESSVSNRTTKSVELGPGALILNKQDFHANKRDSYYGDNDIFDRFSTYENNVSKTLSRANKFTNLESITYIIGSDHFNSEVTGATVKGTIQANILDYQVSFQLVCEHEVRVIQSLLESSDKVNIIYLVGNHDMCVSFHMASWLKVYFRNDSRINVDISSDFTKYFNLFDTAVCINHGDVQKPERLAQNFPLEYKEGFGIAEFHIILTGDRHTELTRDIGGIKFYQIPALSKAKGTWEKQMGYTTTHAQMTSFLIEPGNGVSVILKETL